MGCEFTEEVSLLVDGELPPHEAARLRAHAEGCAACKHAREAFLLLRQELRSYEWTPDPRAQSKALAAILDSRARVAEAAPREKARGLWERLGGAFGGRGLRPAHVAALSLLLIATALGLRWFTGSYTSPRTRQSETPLTANADKPPTRAEDASKSSENSNVGDDSAAHQAKSQKGARPAAVKPPSRGGRESAQIRRDYRTGRGTREGLSHDSPRDVARIETSTPQLSSANPFAPYTAGNSRAAAADPALRIGRHAERVERLLRSFRNARLNDNDPTLDVADARRLSKRLLYSNIALRREAAGAGDVSVKGWLDSLEPILLDISNLPNNPSPGAVVSIKESIRRRQLVGVLQAQAMLASRQ
jgi:hypothetical protein